MNVPRRIQSGLSLVELMVGLAVSLIVLLIVIQIYSAARTSFRFQEGASRIQEAARFVSEQISQDVRSVGYQGCGVLSNSANVVTGFNAAWWLNTTTVVRGYGETLAFPAELQTPAGAAALNTSDAIVILRGDSTTEKMVTDHDTAAFLITTGAAHGFQAGNVLMATDCQQTAVFQISNAPSTTTIEHATGGPSPGNCKNGLGSGCEKATANTYKFRAGSLISRLSANAYFIAASSTGNGRSLWMRSLGDSVDGNPRPALEMAQGVEGLQLLYGIDDAPEDGSANRFMTAAEVDAAALWQSVVSVRLELLLRSEDANLVPTAQTYNYNEAATTAPDTRLYRVYTTTINLRNRTP